MHASHDSLHKHAHTWMNNIFKNWILDWCILKTFQWPLMMILYSIHIFSFLKNTRPPPLCFEAFRWSHGLMYFTHGSSPEFPAREEGKQETHFSLNSEQQTGSSSHIFISSVMFCCRCCVLCCVQSDFDSIGAHGGGVRADSGMDLWSLPLSKCPRVVWTLFN